MRKMKILAIMLLLSMIVGTSTGCYWIVEDLLRNHYTVTLQAEGEPQLASVYNEEYNSYDVSLTGLVKNSTEENVSISIEATIYDAEGNVIGVAYDYIEQITAGETWRFCATTQTAFEAGSYRINLLEAVKEIY